VPDPDWKPPMVLRPDPNWIRPTMEVPDPNWVRPLKQIEDPSWVRPVIWSLDPAAKPNPATGRIALTPAPDDSAVPPLIEVPDLAAEHPLIAVPDPRVDPPMVEVPDLEAKHGTMHVPDMSIPHPTIAVLDMDLEPPLVTVPNPDCKLPPDAAPITEEEHRRLLDAQSQGKLIRTSARGKPEAVDRPMPDADELRQRLGFEVQVFLDAQARAMGYDNIVTAITYAEEPAVIRFQDEGKALRAWRSLVWDAFYKLIEKGDLPAKADLLAELPQFKE
jgi:hypothetical protein